MTKKLLLRSFYMFQNKKKSIKTYTITMKKYIINPSYRAFSKRERSLLL